jgi:RNA polymerase sigma factor (sigma-70 family)
MANPPLKVDLEGCIHGKKEAWDQFVRACSALIHAAVKRSYGARPCPQHELEDRVQDVFVHLVQNEFRVLRNFDSKRASLSTYLTLVARSVAHQHGQKRRIDAVAMESFELRASSPQQSEPLPALNGLTERQQAVLQMLFEQGMTVEEAAHRLDVDPQTIRSTKHKALTRLRQGLRNSGNSGDSGGLPENPRRDFGGRKG